MKTTTAVATAPFLLYYSFLVLPSHTTSAFQPSSLSSRVKSKSQFPGSLLKKQGHQREATTGTTSNNYVSNNHLTELNVASSRRTLITADFDETTTRESEKKDISSSSSTNENYFDTADQQGMNDLVPFLQRNIDTPSTASVGGDISATESGDDELTSSATFDPQSLLVVAAPIIFGAAVLGVASTLGYSPNDVFHFGQQFVSNPQDSMSQVIESVKDMGPIGLVYYGLLYVVAELLAIPATPLTLSAGYLFGMTGGISVVLAAGAISSCIGFLIGKTLLRDYVETIVEENPKFNKIDKAVGKEGFKLLLLIRLSPIFPFALVNYLYGASSIGFVPFIGATLLGFVPSTAVYVYTGMVGQALTIGGSGDSSQPWYVYAGGLTLLAGLLKLVTDVATGVIETINEDDAPQ